MLRKLEILLLLYPEFLTTPKYEISAKPVLGCGRPAWSPQVVTMAGARAQSPAQSGPWSARPARAAPSHLSPLKTRFFCPESDPTRASY